MVASVPILRPADLILVSGRQIMSRLIKLRTCNKWQALRSVLGCPTWRCISHMAICAGWQGETLIWESTTLSTLPCAIRGRRHAGMQAHRPAEWCGGSRDYVWVARLAPHYPLRPEDSRRLTDFLLAHIDRDYDPRGAVEAGVGWRHDADLSRVYCSEIVEQALMVADVIPRGSPDVTPAESIRRKVADGIYIVPERVR